MSPTQKAEIEDLQRQTVTHLQKQNKTNKKRHLEIQKCIPYLSCCCDQLLEKKQLKVCFGTWFEGISEYTRMKKAWQLMALQRHRVWLLLAHILVEQESQRTYAIRKR